MLDKTDVGTTLDCLRSIKPNMINHFANQSQTCQLLKTFFFLTLKTRWYSYMILVLPTDIAKSMSIIERVISIYVYRHISRSWFHILTTSLACVQVYGSHASYDVEQTGYPFLYHVYDVCAYHTKNSDEATKGRGLSQWKRTKLKLMGAILLLFRWLPIVGI